MQLAKYFNDKPRGSKKEFAKKLKITQTWLGLLISRTRAPSPKLAKMIERLTEGKVKAKQLRPDLFD